MTRRLAGLFLFAALVAGCSSGSDKEAAEPKAEPTPTADATTTTAAPEPSPDDDLEAAVQDYSKAFLGGDGEGAYALLSKRCQATIAANDFNDIATQAKDQYGELNIESLKVSVDGDSATATYTYPVEPLNQTGEKWIDEGGWKNDDC